MLWLKGVSREGIFIRQLSYYLCEWWSDVWELDKLAAGNKKQNETIDQANIQKNILAASKMFSESTLARCEQEAYFLAPNRLWYDPCAIDHSGYFIMLPNKRKLEQISPTAVVESNLEKLLGDDLAQVRQLIQERAKTGFNLVDEVIQDAIPEHFPRAIIVLGASRLGRSQQKQRVALAAAIELLNLAITVHNMIPRGVIPQTEQNRVLMGSAILIGDYSFGQASILAASTGKPEVVAAFADSLARLSESRVVTLIETPDHPYADSAILYASAAEVGALLAGLPRPLRYALREAAASFGEVLTDSETSVIEAIQHLESLTKDRPVAKHLTTWLRTNRPVS